MQVGGAKALHTRELKSGVDTSDEGLKAAWSQVKESSGTAPWALYTYGEGSSTKIVLDSTGEGFDNLLEKLSDDKVYFGGLRCTVDGTQPKFFSFLFVGEGVGGMKRGKAAMHKNGVLNGVLESVHGELSFPTREGFTRASAQQQIQKLTGARQVDL